MRFLRKTPTVKSAPPNRKRSREKNKNADVNQRADKSGSKLRPMRKILGAALRFVVAASITGLTLWGGVVVYRHATTAEYFSVEEIVLTGAQRLTEADVYEICRITKGQNIFAVDTEEMSARLRAHPWIAEAQTVRKLPQSVFIEIVERKAEILVLFDVPYLVDDSGDIFKRWSIGDPVLAPILTGLTREQLVDDEEDVRSTVRDAIALARRYRSSGLQRVAPLSEIHREVDGAFSISVGSDPFYVRLGKGPYRRKLTRLTMLLGKMKRDGERPAMIYFDNEVRPDRVTVKAKPEEDTPPGPIQISSAD